MQDWKQLDLNDKNAVKGRPLPHDLQSFEREITEHVRRIHVLLGFFVVEKRGNELRFWMISSS